MADKKYKVIVSDRAKQMLGVHFRFMTQVNKEAGCCQKERTDHSDALLRAYVSALSVL